VGCAAHLWIPAARPCAAGLGRQAAHARPWLAAWLAISAASFGVGFLIAFMFDLGYMKWWLTRFLVPGTAMALTCLGFAALIVARDSSPGASLRKLALPGLVAAATLGPMIELMTIAYRNFYGASVRGDPILPRLAAIARQRSFLHLRRDRAGSGNRPQGPGAKNSSCTKDPRVAWRCPRAHWPSGRERTTRHSGYPRCRRRLPTPNLPS
jgi:hypothetical protein